MSTNGITAEHRIVEYQDETDPTVRDGWSIQNLGGLQWALERMGDLATEVAELDVLKLQAIARIEARTVKLTARARSGVAWFESRIREYMAAHREELLRGGKKKSRDLPSGRVGWRSRGGKLKVVD